MTENEILKAEEDFVVLDGENSKGDNHPTDPTQVAAEAVQHMAESINTADKNNKEFNIKAVDARRQLAKLTCQHPEMKDALRLYAEDINENAATVNENYKAKNENLASVFWVIVGGLFGVGVGIGGAYLGCKQPKLFQPLVNPLTGLSKK